MKLSKDRVYRKIERSMDNKIYVKGTTLIDHRIRVEFGLTLREYVLLDFLYNWHSKSNKKVTYADIWIHTGLINRKPIVDRMFQRLKEKALLWQDHNDMNKVKVTERWERRFNTTQFFKELWKLMNTGVKKKAEMAVKNAVKVSSEEDIKNGLIKYLDYLSKTNQYPCHLSTFLSARNKMWEGNFDATPYIHPSKVKKEQPVNAGPQSKW